MNEYEQFKLCTTDKITRGRRAIKCKLGLWSVESVESNLSLEDEALHYFRQYKDDGEYFQILGEESPAEILMRNGII